MKRVNDSAMTLFQVIGMALIWWVCDRFVTHFHFPIPSNLTAMLLLLLLVFGHIVNVEWFRRGATWLLAEMLLFFVPAVVAVVNYQSLLLQEGLKILAVLVISTILVIATTSIVVDRLYRLELKMARQKKHHQVKVRN